MLSEKYQRLIKAFADPSQGASAGQQMPAPQQDPNQQQQMQNNQGQQVDPNQQDPNRVQQPQQPDPNQLAQQQNSSEEIQHLADIQAKSMMERVAVGTVYLLARNAAINKGFIPGTPEMYRYIGEFIEATSGAKY